jgi:hypothetical protein
MRQEIAVTLSPAERELFYRFQESDQWHAYRVFATLKETGQLQPDLLAAALLHDVGKTKVNLSVWDRILIVITELLQPDKVKSWGQGNLQSWKRPFVVRLRHAHWGAEMARSADSSARTIGLIRHHQDPVAQDSESIEDEMLRLLQRADDLN